MQMTECED